MKKSFGNYADIRGNLSDGYSANYPLGKPPTLLPAIARGFLAYIPAAARTTKRRRLNSLENNLNIQRSTAEKILCAWRVVRLRTAAHW